MKRCEVVRISDDGLHKDVYEFQATGTLLEYAFYHAYNRSSVEEPWPDEWPEAKSWKEWCKSEGMDADDILDRYWNEEEMEICSPEFRRYEKYCESLNPCMVKTKDGRVCGFGQCGHNLSKSHPLPQGAKNEALHAFVKVAEVIG